VAAIKRGAETIRPLRRRRIEPMEKLQHSRSARFAGERM
jgi:hypothetical protein